MQKNGPNLPGDEKSLLSCFALQFVRTFVPSNINTQFIHIQGCKKSFPLIQLKEQRNPSQDLSVIIYEDRSWLSYFNRRWLRIVTI